MQRAREWDAVVTVEAEGVTGERVRFVALADDTLLVEEGGEVEPLAAALEGVVPLPYRAEAVRRGETQWAVGIRRIKVVELPDDPGGDELTLTVQDGERTLLVDGASTFGSIPELEELGALRSQSYVVEGRRGSRTTLGDPRDAALDGRPTPSSGAGPRARSPSRPSTPGSQTCS